MLPASKTGTLSAAAVARHVVVRPEAVGHAGPRCSLEWPGDTATLWWCREAACPEGDAVCGCESLISKWHCVRSRFRTVLKSGSGLSVAALWAGALQRSARVVPRGGCAVSTDDNDRLTPFDGVVNDEIGYDFTVVLQRVPR